MADPKKPHPLAQKLYNRAKGIDPDKPTNSDTTKQEGMDPVEFTRYLAHEMRKENEDRQKKKQEAKQRPETTRGQETDDTFIDNVGEGFEQGGRQLLGGFANFSGEVAEAIGFEEAGQKTQRVARDFINRGPEPDGSKGQFVGSIIPSVIPSAAAVIAAPYTGGSSIAALSMGGLGASSAGNGMLEYESYKKAKGQEVDEAAKWFAGLGYGVSEIAMERFGLSKVLPKFGGKLLMKGSPNGAEKMGRSVFEAYAKENPQAAKQLMKKVRDGFGAEALQEGMTEIAQTATKIAYLDNDDRLNELRELPKNVMMAGLAGGMMGAGIGPLSYNSQNTVNRNRRKKQGFVALGQREKGGDAFELINYVKNEQQDGYQAIDKNGEQTFIPKEELTNYVQLKPQQFDKLLQDKFDQQEWAISQMEPIEEGIYKDQPVIIKGRDESGDVYINIDGEDQLVPKDMVKDIRQVPPEEIYERDGNEVVEGYDTPVEAATEEDAPNEPQPIQNEEGDFVFPDQPGYDELVNSQPSEDPKEKLSNALPQSRTFTVGKGDKAEEVEFVEDGDGMYTVSRRAFADKQQGRVEQSVDEMTDEEKQDLAGKLDKSLKVRGMNAFVEPSDPNDKFSPLDIRIVDQDAGTEETGSKKTNAPKFEESRGTVEVTEEENKATVRNVKAQGLDIKSPDVGQVNPEFKEAPKVEGVEHERTLESGESRNSQYMAVPLESILASHDEVSFKQTEGYPVLEDGRTPNDNDYQNSPSARARVDEISMNLDGRIFENIPTISTDGIVVDGNNRTMSIKKAQKQYPERWEWYQNELAKRAEQYGIDPERLNEMDNPVLVRVDKDVQKYDTETYGKYNVQPNKEKSNIDRAVIASKRLTTKDLAKLTDLMDFDRFSTINEAMSDRKVGKGVIDYLQNIGLISANERVRYYDQQSGAVTSEGKTFATLVAQGAVLNERALRNSTIDGVRQISNAIETSLPILIKIKGTYPEYDLSGYISEAINAERSRVESGRTIDELYSEPAMFSELNLDKDSALMHFIMKKGQNNFKKVMETYLKGVESNANNQLFEEEQRDQDALINDIIDYITQRYEGKRNEENALQRIGRLERAERQGTGQKSGDDSGPVDTQGQPTPEGNQQAAQEEQVNNPLGKFIGKAQYIDSSGKLVGLSDKPKNKFVNVYDHGDGTGEVWFDTGSDYEGLAYNHKGSMIRPTFDIVQDNDRLLPIHTVKPAKIKKQGENWVLDQKGEVSVGEYTEESTGQTGGTNIVDDVDEQNEGDTRVSPKEVASEDGEGTGESTSIEPSPDSDIPEGAGPNATQEQIIEAAEALRKQREVLQGEAAEGGVEGELQVEKTGGDYNFSLNGATATVIYDGQSASFEMDGQKEAYLDIIQRNDAKKGTGKQLLENIITYLKDNTNADVLTLIPDYGVGATPFDPKGPLEKLYMSVGFKPIYKDGIPGKDTPDDAGIYGMFLNLKPNAFTQFDYTEESTGQTGGTNIVDDVDEQNEGDTRVSPKEVASEDGEGTGESTSIEPSPDSDLNVKEQQVRDELSDLFDEFDDLSRGQANIGIDPKMIQISGKIIAKGAELGFVKLQQFADWVINNKGADFWRRIFPNFKAAYSANLSMQGNPNDEDLNAIAKSTSDDYIQEVKELTPTAKFKKLSGDVAERIGSRDINVYDLKESGNLTESELERLSEIDKEFEKRKNNISDETESTPSEATSTESTTESADDAGSGETNEGLIDQHDGGHYNRPFYSSFGQVYNEDTGEHLNIEPTKRNIDLLKMGRSWGEQLLEGRDLVYNGATDAWKIKTGNFARAIPFKPKTKEKAFEYLNVIRQGAGLEPQQMEDISDNTDDTGPAFPVSAILAENDLEVEERTSKKGNTFWVVTGDGTYQNKELIKEIAESHDQKPTFNGNLGGWLFFKQDPTEELAERIDNQLGEGAGSSNEDSGAGEQDNTESQELNARREEELDRPDQSSISGSVQEYVADETQALIRKGEDFGVPEVVTTQQIEDAARIVRAFEDDKGMFVLGNAAGSGKTFVLGGAIKELKSRGADKILYVTMNNGLIDQINEDLSEYGIEDVEFITYAKMRTTSPSAYDAILFDEAHSIKNTNSKQGKKAKKFIDKAKFTVFASATPFENPVETQYLEPTGVFEKAGGYVDWAKMFGARTKKIRQDGKIIKEIPYWVDNTDPQLGQQARTWLWKEGVMQQRDMQIPPEMTDVQFQSVSGSNEYVDMYTDITDALEEAIDLLDSNFDRPLLMQLSGYKTNLQKRILEASKIQAGIERAEHHIDQGRSAVIFVETKAERNIPAKQIVEDMGEWESMKSRGMDVGKPPHSKVVYQVATSLQMIGIDNLTLPSTESVIEDHFGADNVAIYTGSQSDKQANDNLEEWRAQKKKVLVATMAKGGTGLSLHDTEGDRPTAQININLPWKATGVDQVAGRVTRYGIKSTAYVEWLFSDNIPFDQELASRVSKRMSDMGAIVKGSVPDAVGILEDYEFQDTQSIDKGEASDSDGLKDADDQDQSEGSGETGIGLEPGMGMSGFAEREARREQIRKRFNPEPVWESLTEAEQKELNRKNQGAFYQKEKMRNVIEQSVLNANIKMEQESNMAPGETRLIGGNEVTVSRLVAPNGYGRSRKMKISDTAAKYYNLLEQKVNEISSQIDQETGAIDESEIPESPDGKYQIYETVVDGEPSYAVPSRKHPEERGFGDRLYDTLDEAKEMADFNRKQDEQSAKMRERREAESAKEAQAQAERENLRGYEDTMEGRKRGRVISILNKQMGYDGEVITRKALVEQKVDNGAQITTFDGERALKMLDDTFLTQDDITKTAMDYAEYLIGDSVTEAKEKTGTASDFFESESLDQYTDEEILSSPSLTEQFFQENGFNLTDGNLVNKVLKTNPLREGITLKDLAKEAAQITEENGGINEDYNGYREIFLAAKALNNNFQQEAEQAPGQLFEQDALSESKEGSATTKGDNAPQQPRSPQALEVQREVENAQEEYKAAIEARDRKKRELEKKAQEDNQDLFGEREYDGGMFDQRADLNQIPKQMEIYNRQVDMAKAKLDKWKKAQQDLQDNPEPNLFDGGMDEPLAKRLVDDVKDSNSFQQWFGDSKVVDEDGEPLVVYRGETWVKSSSFDPSYKGDGMSNVSHRKGVFFTDNLDVAATYSGTTKDAPLEGRSFRDEGMQITENYANPDMLSEAWKQGQVSSYVYSSGSVIEKEVEVIKMVPFMKDQSTESAERYLDEMAKLREEAINVPKNTFRVYLKLENPLIVDFNGKEWNDGPNGQTVNTLSLKAEIEGYDGVIVKNVRDVGRKSEIDSNREVSDVYIVYDSTQAKSATGNSGAFDSSDPSILAKRLVDDTVTSSKNFQEWFKGSHVLDEDGNPLTVLHGTTGDFDTFSRENANVESDLGAGFYFTNNPDDLENNYAGEGPDLTQKIQTKAERIASEEDADYDDPAIIARAKRELGVQHEGASMPVYLDIKNPVELKERGGTYLETGIIYDADDYMDEAREELEDYYDEPGEEVPEDELRQLAEDMAREAGGDDFDGGVLGLIQEIEKLSWSNEFDSIEIDQIREDMLMESLEGGWATDIIQSLKESEGLAYATDDVGNFASGEIIRKAFEGIGYDGFIDYTVNKKFGSERDKGRPMAGMNPNTVHYIAFDPKQIKSAIGNNGEYNPNNPNILAKRIKETTDVLYKRNESDPSGDDLVAMHNINGRKLQFADKQGGLAVPSLAVTDPNIEFDSFGDITLIGSVDLIDPKGSGNATFGADIYSPRYPEVIMEVKDRDKFVEFFGKYEGLTGQSGWPTLSDLQDGDMFRFKGDINVMAAFADSIDQLPDAIYEERPPVPEAFVDFMKDMGSNPTNQEIMKDDRFPELYRKARKEEYQNMPESYRDNISEERYMSKYFYDGDEMTFGPKSNFVKDLIKAVKTEPEVDTRAFKDELWKIVDNNKEAYDNFAYSVLDNFNINEKIFNGFTAGGSKKFLAHSLDNVVRLMKKKLRSGENFNYGVGNIRSQVAPQFRSVQEIRDNKDKLVTEEDFNEIKEEVNDEFMELANALEDYYQYAGGFRYMDEVSEMFGEIGLKSNFNHVLKEFGFEGVPAELKNSISQYLQKLSTLPTQYFESKPQRAVDISEFEGAVIPNNAPDYVREILDKHNVPYHHYNESTKGDRQRAISRFSNAFFKRIDDARSPIRMARTDKIKNFLEDKTKGWARRKNIVIVDNEVDLPQPLQNYLNRDPDRIGGLYYNGKAYLLAHNLKNTDEAIRTLNHEVIGHLGVRGLISNLPDVNTRDEFNDRLDTIMGEVYDRFKNDDYYNEIARKYRAHPSQNNSDKTLVGQEFIAHLAEDGTEPGLVDKMMAFLEDLLRKLGINSGFTRGDLYRLLRDARKFVDSDMTYMKDGHQFTAFRYSDYNHHFYSELQYTLESKLSGKGTVNSYKEQIEGFERKGDFRKAEIEWVGLYEWLEDQEGKITKEEVLDYVRDHNVVLDEVMKGGKAPKDVTDNEFRVAEARLFNLGYELDQGMGGEYAIIKNDDSQEMVMYDDLSDEVREQVDIMMLYLEDDGMPEPDQTKYGTGDLVLPGGTDYREMLITLPTRANQAKVVEVDGNWYIQYPNEELSPYPYNSKEVAERELEAHKANRSEIKRADEYRNSHWQEPNVLAHVRFNTREGNMLFLEEIQSDWHQEGRKKGYADKKKEQRIYDIAKGLYNLRRNTDMDSELKQAMADQFKVDAKKYGITNEEISSAQDKYGDFTRDLEVSGVPNAPFKTTWHELAIKRMIRYAAENGYQKVGWAPGEVHNERYNLADKVDSIQLEELNSGLWLKAYSKEGGELIIDRTDLAENELEDYIGKELAERAIEGLSNDSDQYSIEQREDGKYVVIDQDGEPLGTNGLAYAKSTREAAEKLLKTVSGNRKSELKGVDLEIGGEGMKGFYDKMLPRYLNKYLKKFDSKLGVEPLPLAKNGPTVQRLDAGDYAVYDVEGHQADAGFATREEAFEAAKEMGLFNDAESQDIWSFPVTDKMREIVTQEGQPLFKRMSGPVQETEMQYERRLDNQVRKYQDMAINIKRMQGFITEGGGTINDESDTHSDFTQYRGRIDSDMRRFKENHQKPMVKELLRMYREENISYDEVWEYMYAKHAPDRNEFMHKKNPKKGKAQSGWSDEKAERVMKKFQNNGKAKTLERFTEEHVRGITDYILQKRRDTGLITEQRYKELKKMFDFYVPLRGFKDLIDIDPTMYSGDMKMEGRSSEAGDILAYLMAMKDTAIVQGNKNVMKQKLLNMAVQNYTKFGGDQESSLFRIKNVFWKPTGETTEDGRDEYVAVFNPSSEEILKGDLKRVLDSDNETGDWREKDQFGNPFENTNIRVMKDGRAVVIEFKDPNVAKAINGVGVDKVPDFMNGLNRYMSILRNVITQWSPEFAIRNLLRDSTTAGINLGIDFDVKTATSIVNPARIAKSFSGIRKVLRDGDFDGDWGKAFKEFEELGGISGWWQLNPINDRTTKLKEMVERGTFGKDWKKNGKQGVKHLGQWLEDYNRVFENVVRVSTYKYLTDNKVKNPKTGKTFTPKQAAMYAKDLTVNFNRKGEYSGAIGGFHLFFNAAVQGIARQVQPFMSGDTRQQLRASATPLIMASTAVLFIEMMRMGMGEDEDGEYYYDKIPEWTRQHNVILPNLLSEDPTDYVKIPLPYGFNVYWAAGDVFDRVAHGSSTLEDGALSMVSAAFDSFNPIGTGAGETFTQAVAKTVSPTYLEPLFEMSVNQDFSGRAIKPEQFPFALDEPESNQYFPWVASWAKGLAKGLNKATGGDDVVSGVVDISPEYIEYVAEYFGGGSAKFINGLIVTGENVIGEVTGSQPWEASNIYNIPFARSTYGKVTDSITRQRFIEYDREVRDVVDNYSQYIESNPAKAQQYFKQQKDVITLEPKLKAIQKQLRYLEKIRRLSEGQSAVKGNTLDKIEEQMNDLMSSFNKSYNDAVKGSRRSLTDILTE